MLELFNQIFASHGLGGLFVLMFLNMVVFTPPSELILPLAGFFAYTSGHSLLLVITVAVFANFLGTYVWYFIGMRVGYRWLFKIKYFRKRISEESILRLAKKLRGEGSYWVGVFRLFPSVRALISIPAGMIKMPHRRFITHTLIGLIVWTSFWTLFGYFAGLGFVEYKIGVLICLVVVFVVVAFIFERKVKGYLIGKGLRTKGK